MARRVLGRGLALAGLAAALIWAWREAPPSAGESAAPNNPAAGLPGQPVVRMLLMDDVAEAKLEIHGRPLIDYPGRDAGQGPLRHSADSRTYTLLPDDQGVRVGDRIFPGLTFTPDDGAPLVLRWAAGGAADSAAVRHVLRHRLSFSRVQAPAAGGKKSPPKLRAIVHMPLEEYLAVVLPSEVPSHWPIEALKAQAVAARTYALAAIIDRPRAEYHMGLLAMAWHPDRARNSPQAQRALQETAGIVMLERGRLFPAYFHAECGGFTTDARLALPNEETRYFTALMGVRCERCATLRRDDLEYKNDYPLSPAEITQRLRAAKLLDTDNEVLGLSVHANRYNAKGEGEPVPAPLAADMARRVSWIILQTRKGPMTIHASRFRMAVGRHKKEISSTYMRVMPPTVDGRYQFQTQGYGHGAGLCQWGAEQAARVNRLRYPAILQWYYPGIKLAHYYGGN